MLWANLLHIYQPPHWDARVIDRVVRESYRPIVDILTRHPRVRVTLNVSASLTEQLVRLGYDDVIRGIRALAERKQIEFTGSAKYHPILPLLPPDEVRRQIRLNTETNRSILGPCYDPKGFFPPEMAANLDLIGILIELGFRWVALDEVASADPSDGSTCAKVSPFEFTAILRNRNQSDYLSFLAPPDQPRAFFEQPQAGPTAVLVTAFDGENLGHHRPGTDRLWERLVTDPNVTTITYSEFVEQSPKDRIIDLRPSSWSTRLEDLEQNTPYPLWDNPDNQIHALQWSLTRLVIDAVANGERRSDQGSASARLLLDETLASDQYWWASAAPWWSVEIVAASAERFGRTLDALTSLPAAEQHEARQLITAIARQARAWQDDGTARQRRSAFLRAARTVKYLGGERVDASTG